MKSLENIRRNGITEKELRNTKEQLKGSIVFDLKVRVRE